ncbi:ATP-binding cassette domain-containing protein [Neorhodopirellula pilleata]|uniref:Fe(3+) ions import ATP-binding protein FbpC n=1 Tax=Neorhodopirellula pilleata TaxID=2714738 RepID=A0A5C6A019_9BACT|nr:ATP-binding cassette domain-containing protein [Neorhodopirellula pilleata]TWT93164.1 Fe(3+) ions import ATP-binding protein FbpC [Neorhodopirellula pilleata]
MDEATTPNHRQADLRIENLNVTAGGNVLLRDASVTLPHGKITVLVGGSGAGKSVLLRVLAGILPRDGESITWSGAFSFDRDSSARSSSDRPQRTGIVFQQFALFDELNPVANVQFAIDHRRDRHHPPRYRAMQWLELLGVPSSTHVAALSGGQKQRLAIARTLAADPEIILYDEPTSGLDAASGRRVAELIRETQRRFGRTSLVVTHDYETLLGFADQVLLLDSHTHCIRPVPTEQRDGLADLMDTAGDVSADRQSPPTSVPPQRVWGANVLGWLAESAKRFLTATGDTLIAVARLPIDAFPIVPRPRWAARFLGHYLRLIGGPSACVYLIIAGLITGFTTTYFTLRFLPFRLYTQPLLIDEMLASIGFALYRILVPVLATVLIAARCGAAVAADVGVKQYGGQIDALRTLGVRPPAYLLVPILGGFLIATPILEWIAFTASHWISRFTFLVTYPEIGIHFWHQHFFRAITPKPDSFAAAFPDGGLFLFGQGWAWVLLKNSACGIGTAAIAYHSGMSPKQSAGDVSAAITSTVLWTTLYVLIVHFVIALMEF